MGRIWAEDQAVYKLLELGLGPRCLQGMEILGRNGIVCSMPAALPFLTMQAAEQRDTTSDQIQISTILEIRVPEPHNSAGPQENVSTG